MTDPVGRCVLHGEFSLHTGCLKCDDGVTPLRRPQMAGVQAEDGGLLSFRGRPWNAAGPVRDESAQRKATPIFSGVMRYFPDALAAVARLSKIGNDKHNPGEPLNWSRHKSTDHGDCIARHQITFDELDPESGEYHAAAVAWRALAQLQLLEEKRARERTGIA